MELPEIVFGSSDSQRSQEIAGLVKLGQLRQLLPRVYTSNFQDSDENIIRRNLWQLLAHSFSGAQLSHRSAIEFQISPKGNLYLAGRNRRVYRWPGVTIRVQIGPEPLNDDLAIYGEFYASSLERAALENLMPSRLVEGERRTLGQTGIEERLIELLNTRGEEGLNQFRDRAREIAGQLGWHKTFERLNRIISSLLSTKPSAILRSPLARAIAFGEPYDTHRIALFRQLIGGLRQYVFPLRPAKTTGQQSYDNIAFFEAFFSNYIEGTTFLLEEAQEIINEQKLLPNRSGDSHDILGTYAICQNRQEMSKEVTSADDFIALLQARHAIIMRGRPDKQPGQFKRRANRAGSSHFVAPGEVRGTLKEGFKMMAALREPIARAIYMMFVVSEVHPFDDGNGRIARIMMNAELVIGQTSKLIIPTVYREDYMLNLKKVTRDGKIEGFIRMMDRAHAFSHWLEPADFEQMLQQLKVSNAFKESEEAVLQF